MNDWEAEFEHAEPGGVPTLFARGEIDLSGVSSFTLALERLVREPMAPVAVVDLAGVVFIDSAGVRELLKAKLKAEAAESQLVLRSLSPACRRVLELSGVLAEFTVAGAD